MLQQIFEARIRLFGRAEACELAHRPELAAIAGRMYAARVRELAGEGRVAREVYVGRVGRRVEASDRIERDSLELLFALRHPLECGRERLLLPALDLGLLRRRQFFDLSHGFRLSSQASAACGKKHKRIYDVINRRRY